MQDEAVFSLAGMLNIGLQPEARQVLTAGGTSDPGAYEFYLQGRGHLQRFDRIDEITTVIGFFRLSLEKDTEFALASAELGVAHLYLFRRTEDVSWIEPAVEYTEPWSWITACRRYTPPSASSSLKKANTKGRINPFSGPWSLIRSIMKPIADVPVYGATWERSISTWTAGMRPLKPLTGP